MRVKCFFWAGLGLYALLSVADWMLTFALLRIHPGAVESNPLAAACLEQHGWRGLALYKTGGVLVFTAAVVLLLRRRPAIATSVVGAGCAALLWVTIYSHGLLCQAHREAEDRAHDFAWQEAERRRGTERESMAVPERCWFAGAKRPPTSPNAVASRQPAP
jgi:hypothetical protein